MRITAVVRVGRVCGEVGWCADPIVGCEIRNEDVGACGRAHIRGGYTGHFDVVVVSLLVE